ncbi:E3 ubiquitin-protein ligase RNF8 [Discoglossus pictus]
MASFSRGFCRSAGKMAGSTAQAVLELGWCLRRLGKNQETLLLPEGQEVTIGRGLGVTYQLTSTLSPLMISRTHCLFKQNKEGMWTVTDNKSLNGVWVNKERLVPSKAHVLSVGACIQLGVPLPNMEEAEFAYKLIHEPLERIFTSPNRKIPVVTKVLRTKRKFNAEDSESSGSEGTSNSSKVKVYRGSKDGGEPSNVLHRTELSKQPTVKVSMDLSDLQDSVDGDSFAPTQQQCPSTLQLSKVRQTMVEIRGLSVEIQKKQMEIQQSQVRERTDVLKKLHDMQNQLSNQQEEHLQMVQDLKQIFQEEQQGEHKLADDEQLKEQLAQALQEHTLLMEELNRNKNNFDRIIEAMDKELQENKEEQEKKVRAQKDDFMSHINDVLDNELQCIICSEHFIEPVTLNCSHTFCSYCIKSWRKRKNECPICRQEICSEIRSLALDNCINSMVDQLSMEMKARREALIKERKHAR